MWTRRQISCALLPAGSALAGQPGPGRTAARLLDVRAFGAAGDGKRLDTVAIQKAIDACSVHGGAVVFPPGTYLSGGFEIKSRVTLQLDGGAVIRGSSKLDDYPLRVPRMRSYTDNYTDRCLIWAEGAREISIEGRGTIDGQGASFSGPYKVRPYLLRMVECADISVSGVTMIDSPMWVQHYLACERVDIRGIRVRSRVNHNNDGIDIDCSRGVRISDCDIWSGDDAIVLKSTAERFTEDVVVTNCVLSSRCNGIKMGTETNGGFRNIAISNCTVYETRLAGLTLQMVDGGLLDGVVVSGLTMRDVVAPLFLRLGDRGRPFVNGGPRPGPGRFRNVTIRDVEATASGVGGCSVTGLPGHPIENLTLENIRLEMAGGGSRREPSAVPESADKYPEHTMFGALPAYGLFCRHVKNLRVRGLETRCLKPDERPALVADDVDGLSLESSLLEPGVGRGPAAVFSNVSSAMVVQCRAADGADPFLRLEGARTARVSLIGNDFSAARRTVDAAPEVPRDAVFEAANRMK